jgi:hypothetical protein
METLCLHPQLHQKSSQQQYASQMQFFFYLILSYSTGWDWMIASATESWAFVSLRGLTVDGGMAPAKPCFIAAF